MDDGLHTRDKRRHLRVPLSATVKVESARGVRHFTTKNISAGGVFLLADDPLPEEARISLEVYLSGSPVPIRAQGEVVWIQRHPPAGFAVRFLEISEQARDYLRFLVQRALDGVPKP
jgi:uncharacterized protein (TIGR02266 family)